MIVTKNKHVAQELSIKYVTLEGVREGVTVCDRGGGLRARDFMLINFLSYI